MLTNTESKIIELIREGYTFRAASTLLGIPKSTLFDAYQSGIEKLEDSEGEQYFPRVLLLDIETAPTLAWVFDRFKVNIGQNQVVQEGYMLTWSAKWLGENIVIADSLHNYPEDLADENDYPLARGIYELVNQADVVIAHNGDRFDMPMLNTRFLFHGFKPAKPYKQVDTLKILKKKFRFPSNALNSVCQFLGLGEKIDTGGFELWAKCMQGDSDAFEEMLEYNIYDVHLLEELYKKIAPWYNNHPSFPNFREIDKPRCTVCTSNNLKENGQVTTGISSFQAFQCNDCGHWLRGRVNLKSKEEMANTFTNA